MSPFLIGLTGYSAAGKTTLANLLEEQRGVQRFRIDAYFKSREDCPKRENGEPNWELPESFYVQEMLEALMAVKQGQCIRMPVYSRPLSKRTGEWIEFEPQTIILVEGIHLYYHGTARSLLDLKFWVDIPLEHMFERQIERGRPYTREYHENVMVPSIKKYIDPMRSHADYYLDGTKQKEILFKELERVIFKKYSNSAVFC